MNARLEPDPRAAAEIDRFRRIRSRMTDLAQGLSAEDLAAQSMPDCSPGKWHLAHTSWFFETFVLRDHVPGYTLHDPRFPFLFNTYYEAEGKRHARARRGMVTRPTLAEVLAAAEKTELASYAANLCRDIDAVQAALDLPWTTSPVEGQINRLKLIKRSMYGRAGFDLLRNRVLNAA